VRWRKRHPNNWWSRRNLRFLLQGLPFDGANRIVAIGTRDVRGRDFGTSVQDFEDLQRASRTVPIMAAAFGANMTLSGDDKAPEQYTGST
jgi:hypothetical protein